VENDCPGRSFSDLQEEKNVGHGRLGQPYSEIENMKN
jgi:hypothetical protein